MKMLVVAMLSMMFLAGCSHSGSAEKKQDCAHCASGGKTDKKGCKDGNCSH